MDSQNFLFLLLTILIVWQVALSIYTFMILAKYKKVTRGTNNLNLEALIQKVLEKQETTETNIKNLNQEQLVIKAKSLNYFQKSALVRFNPFEDAGGDQSFVIALLDAKDNGFVISSLHSRSGTRVYAKPITAGKSSSHSFTREEKETIEKALKTK